MNPLPVIVNPVARGGRSRPPREALEQAAARRGVRLDWWETREPGHATELAARAARDRLPAIAAWGGDGTYNEAARGVVGSETELLFLPGGTTSVLVYELGIPRRPEQALLAQLDGEPRAMTVGRTDRGQLFLLMLSAGPDSLILANLSPRLKAGAGKIGIALQAFVEFGRASLPHFEVTAGDVQREVGWCIVGNARCYGGPYHATPGADPFREGLETVLLNRQGRLAVIPFFFGIPSGRHMRMRGVERLDATDIRLVGDESIPYQIDGDPAGYLPVAAHAASDRVRVRVPRTDREPGSGDRVPG